MTNHRFLLVSTTGQGRVLRYSELISALSNSQRTISSANTQRESWRTTMPNFDGAAAANSDILIPMEVAPRLTFWRDRLLHISIIRHFPTGSMWVAILKVLNDCGNKFKLRQFVISRPRMHESQAQLQTNKLQDKWGSSHLRHFVTSLISLIFTKPRHFDRI